MLPTLLGPDGPAIVRAMVAAQEFLRAHDTAELLARVGQTIDAVPPAPHLDKRFIQASYRGDLAQPPDDLLAGQGLFYLTEQRKLFLDCTAGHYQMTWGYHHPELDALVAEATAAGVVWDDHSNIPGNPVKRLAEKLVECAGNGTGPFSDPTFGPEEGTVPFPAQSPLDSVLLGICTGSVAASSAL